MVKSRTYIWGLCMALPGTQSRFLPRGILPESDLVEQTPPHPTPRDAGGPEWICCPLHYGIKLGNLIIAHRKIHGISSFFVSRDLYHLSCFFVCGPNWGDYLFLFKVDFTLHWYYAWWRPVGRIFAINKFIWSSYFQCADFTSSFRYHIFLSWLIY